jgi:hypothetical protein
MRAEILERYAATTGMSASKMHAYSSPPVAAATGNGTARSTCATVVTTSLRTSCTASCTVEGCEVSHDRTLHRIFFGGHSLLLFPTPPADCATPAACTALLVCHPPPQLAL